MNDANFSASELFSSFYDLSPVCVWIKDTQNNLLKLNKSAAELEGVPASELEGKSCFDIYPRERADAFWHDDLEVITSGEPKLGFYELHTLPGTNIQKWMQVNKVPVKDEAGNVKGVMVYAIDVDEVKRAEENAQRKEKNYRDLVDELSRKEEEFRIVFENSTDAIFWADTDTGEIINCNRSAEELMKMERSQIIGLQHWEIHPKYDKEKYRKYFAEIEKTQPDGLNIEIENSLGQIIPVRIAVSTVRINNKRISQAVISDISERLLYNRALEESEQRYKAVVSNAPVVFFDLGTDGIVRLAEGKGLLSLNLVPEDLVGRSIYDLMKEYPEYLAKIAESFAGANHVLTLEFSRNTFNVFFTPVRNESGIVESVIGIGVDVSEKVKAEKILSHERNILKSIIEIIPDEIYVKDAESRFVVANRKVVERLSAGSQDEVIGKTDFDFFPEVEARLFFTEEQELMRSGVSIINQEIKSLVNNQVMYYEISKIPFYSDDIVTGLVGNSRDITQRKLSEEIVKASETKYRMMAENMKDVVWQLSTDFVFTYLSPSFYQLSGFQPADFIGKSLWQMITAESGEQLTTIINERRKASDEERRTSLIFEATMYHADKSLIYTEIVSNPVFSEKGELIYFQGITRDVTKRKLAELALKESQARLGVVVANAPMVLFQVDTNGIFMFSEGKGLEKLGLKPGQVVGMSVFDIYKDFPDICSQIRHALKGMIVMDTVALGAIFYEILFNPVLNSEGQVTSVIGIAFDVTERKKAQEALHESETRFSVLFHEMTEGVALYELVFDAHKKPVDYKFIEVNTAFINQMSLHGKYFQNGFASDIYGTSNPPFLQEFSCVALSGTKFKFETFFEPLEKYFRISVFFTGEHRFAAVFEDVTVQKKHEKELRDKNDELERFTYTVSHDLKSPLVTIKGFIGMLEQDLIQHHEENIKDDMQRIKSATDKMTDLLNDLLELSRIGRNVNPPVKVSMLTIVEEALELVSGITTARNVKISIPESMPDVFVDKQRMLEVWLNLIENAVKFSEKQEHPEIKIDFHQDDSKFIFSILDNGIGIEQKYQHTIFGLFNKLDNKTSGTGIGLALVKRIAEVHGGSVWVESEGLGKGARFSFSVPKKVKNLKK